MSRRMHRTLVFVLLAASCPGQEPGQSTSQTLTSLQEQVRELQQQVKALQSRLDHAPTSAVGRAGGIL
jgi:hypothetical protein